MLCVCFCSVFLGSNRFMFVVLIFLAIDWVVNVTALL